MNLENIIQPHELDHSKHDNLIKNINSYLIKQPDILPLAMNAYYKLKNNAHKGGWLESDIDLLLLKYEGNFKSYDAWYEVPFADSTLLLFEMKTNDSGKNYSKALYQLYRSKHMIMDYTPYQFIDCFYAFNDEGNAIWRMEHII